MNGSLITFIAGKDPLEEQGGGHSSYVRVHARAAIHIGLEPHLFCASREAGVVETDYGIVHRIPSPLRFFAQATDGGFRHLTVPFQTPLLVRALEGFLINRKPPHVLHGFGVWSSAGVTVGRRLERQGVQTTLITSVYTTVIDEQKGRLRGLTKKHRIRRQREELELLWMKLLVDRCERNAYLGSRLVLFNYDSVCKLFCARFGPAQNLRKLPYTSESAFLHTRELHRPELPSPIAMLQQRDSPLIVAISRHDPRKGLDILLLALSSLMKAGVKFRACLIGRGSLLQSHRDLAQELGLTHCTLIAGPVADPYIYLQHADIFVLPSLQEGGGSLSLIEALQAGVAVVSSNLDGIPEDVVHGDSALLVEPGNVLELREAILQLLTNVTLRNRLAIRAWETFDQKFSAVAFTDALKKTYAEFGLFNAS